MARLVFSEPAQLDLEEIHAYIARDSPAAARRWLERIQTQCKRLAEMPGQGRSRAELAPELRSFTVAPYLIFYVEIEGGVQIARVIHGARDIEAQFH